MMIMVAVKRFESSPSLSFQPKQNALSLLLLLLVLLLFPLQSYSHSVNPRKCGGSVRHVTLSTGPDPSTEMIVSFASISCRFEAPIGGVLVGTSPSSLDELVLEQEPATHYTIDASFHNKACQVCGNDETGKMYYSPYYHHVTISNLKPLTTYYYRPVVQATEQAFDKYNYLRSKPSISSPDFLRGFEELEQQDENEGKDMHDRHFFRFLMDSPYDGSEKECPSPQKIRSFRTAPPPGGYRVSSSSSSSSTSSSISRSTSTIDNDGIITMAIMGDLGQFSHSEETLAHMMKSRDEMDLMILAGDVAYSSTDHRRWDTFLDFLEDYPLAEHIPLLLCPGNHDIDKEENGNDIFLAYENRFRMPRVKPPELGVYGGPLGPMNMDSPPYPLPYEWGNAYYAITYGPARIIMINSYSSMEPDSTQYKWIVSELQAVDRTVTPWLIAVLHTPLYNTFSLHRHDKQIIQGKKHLEPLFVDYKVNLVFTGHIHAYLRTNTVAHDKVHPAGPMHITIGAGGRKCEAPFKQETPEEWVAVRDATVYGYGMFRILNRTFAEWDWVHTGHSEQRDFNQLYKSNATLPGNPGRDRVLIQNQYYL